MAQSFIRCDRDQHYLMPPSLAEWLPAEHLAWFVVDAVSQMDLTAFYARYRHDGWGRAAYEPSMMVALTLYAYCLGERSSRRIERRLREDVGYRVVAANSVPDHTTIARFRQTNDQALADLFGQILRLCAEAGLGKLGLVAIDGTKMGAAAALDANRTREAIDELVREMLEEAAEVDKAEDALFGEGVRGDELPPELATRTGRIARLKEAKHRLEAEQAERERAHQEHLSDRERIERERGSKLRGRKPKAPDSGETAKANLTDPDSRIVKSRQGYLQGYNGQVAVSQDQLIISAELTQDANDVGQLHPMIGATEQALFEAGVQAPIGAVVADAGYMSDQNLADHDPEGPELLVATGSSRTQRAALKDKRPPRGRIPKDATPRERMDRKLRTKAGRERYARRSQIVEPVFGQIKEARGIRRFMRRGLDACQGEWKLIAATHNLLKLFRHGEQLPTGRPGARRGGPAVA